MRPFAVCLALSLVACDKPAAPGSTVADTAAPGNAPPALSAAPSAGAPVPTSVTHGAAKEIGVTWDDPKLWKKLPPTSPMRNATYEVPAADGDKEAADVGVFYFGPDKPGVVERNVERWVQQFEGIDDTKVKKSERKANGLAQRIVEIEQGTYKSGMPGGPTTPKPDFAMIGAIVEAPSGSHFFKLVGPKATVARAKKPFFELLDSVKPKGAP
ncbi:MAG: hypothetical protein IPI67_32930 [Myxococcales bacterium]|nr:hypothetical protein [Myxococcales bacterium]